MGSAISVMLSAFKLQKAVEAGMPDQQAKPKVNCPTKIMIFNGYTKNRS
jgi:hypothetical protein